MDSHVKTRFSRKSVTSLDAKGAVHSPSRCDFRNRHLLSHVLRIGCFTCGSFVMHGFAIDMLHAMPSLTRIYFRISPLVRDCTPYFQQPEVTIVSFLVGGSYFLDRRHSICILGASIDALLVSPPSPIPPPPGASPLPVEPSGQCPIA